MKILIIIIPLFFLLSCSEQSEYVRKSGEAIFIKPKNHGVKHVGVIKWKIGSLFKQEISKGISISLLLPNLSVEQLKEIFYDRNADSYIVRVSRNGLYGAQIIGHSYITFLKRDNGERRFSSPKGGTVNIYYAAAAISKRFENFSCPAFGHAKKIGEVIIKDAPNNLSDQLVLSPLEEVKVSARVGELASAPYLLNGGHTIIDEYKFEIAFYSYISKVRKSNYITLPQSVKVVYENEVSLKGCANFSIPKKTKGSTGTFKFGR